MVLLFLTTTLFAFTLTSTSPPLYSVDEVIVDMANDSCSQTGHSSNDILEIVIEAADKFWNKVPTSRLKLTKGSIKNVSSDGITSSSAHTGLAEKNHIIVGCNDDISAFSSGSVVAVGLVQISGDGAVGSIIINDTPGSEVSNLSREEMKTLIAHEMGHALGLGHSEDEAAIMYYSISNKTQESLTEDDFDGLTYLYPHEKKLGGIAGSCSSIDTSGGKKSLPFLLALMFGLILGVEISKVKLKELA